MLRTILALLPACTGDAPTEPRPHLFVDSGGSPVVFDGGTHPLSLPSPTGDTAPPVDTSEPVPTDEWLFDDSRVLVVPDHHRLSFMANDGSLVSSPTWSELVGPCDECGGEGASADGDGLLVSFTTGQGIDTGTIARLDRFLSLDFRLEGFTFPHDAVRDPLDNTIIVPEASVDEMTWVAGDGATLDPVRVIDGAIPGWTGGIPNGIDRFDYDGRSLLLCSFRGGVTFPPGFGTGQISLWDISVADQPFLVWRYPEDGALDMPHGPLFRRYDDQWWLIYAHSQGALQFGSTVGLAVTDDPTVPPSYVADLLPMEPVAPFIFLRGVELTSDGWLYLTDSGGRGGTSTGIADGRVLKAPMPNLVPTGATGSVGNYGEQVFVDLVGAEVLLTGLDNPFEGWIWSPQEPLAISR